MTRTAFSQGPRSPLEIAGYITWLAIATGPLLRLLRTPDDGALWIGAVALLVFLALLIRRAAIPEGQQQGLELKLVLAQIPVALMVIGFANDGMQTVLLTLVVAQAAMLLPSRRLLQIMVPTNLIAAAILITHWSTVDTLRAMLAYIGFQAFAWLIATYALRAEDARQAAVRITAELLAARELLTESTRADERLRLSRELHDIAGQKLTALKLQLALLARRVSPEQAAFVETMRGLADELLTEMRGIVSTLRHHEGVDLHAALRALAQAFPQPAIVLSLDAEARAPDIASAETLLRVAQEGLTNAVRHSGANQIQLSLSQTDGQLRLCVSDNGHGLSDAAGGNGIAGMRERLDAIGGSLQLHDSADDGLTLEARVPLAETEPVAGVRA